MKKVLACVLCLVLCLSSISCVFAAGDEAVQAARQLCDLGLFRGVGTNEDGSPDFDLDRAPTRAEAMTMIVRLFMDENAALMVNYDCPFSDVAQWARPYVGYAYEYGMTDGQSETVFGGESPVAATEYLTFILRALGYESGVDFRWDRAWELSDRLGITDGRYREGSGFTRADVVIVSLSALKLYKPIVLAGENTKVLDTIASYAEPGFPAEYEPLTLTPAEPLRDLRIVSLGVPAFFGGDEDDFRLVVYDTLLYVGDVGPGQGIEVSKYWVDFYANWGVVFTDQNGNVRAFSLYCSLRDGSIRIAEDVSL